MTKYITDLQVLKDGNKNLKETEKNPSKKPKGKKRRKIIIFGILFILLILIGLYFLWPGARKKLEEIPKNLTVGEKVETSPFDTESPLNGVLTTKEKSKRRPEAVMIENHPDARPQSGLNKAGLVYEALTEGGITRFLAFFVENDASEVGPVRSARTYFVKLADEYNAFYAHAGGNADALALIKELSGFYNLDEFSLGNFFWRDKNRFAPHNLYTTTDKLRSAGESKNWDVNTSYDKWLFKDDEKLNKRGNTQKISVNFSTISYKVDYFYDKDKNEYKRNLAGKPHIDKNSKEQIKAKTVIIQYVKSWKKVGDSNNGIELEIEGTGKTTIFMDGNKIQGSWKKSDRKQRTKFYSDNGKEVEFDRGPIWIELVPDDTKVSSE